MISKWGMNVYWITWAMSTHSSRWSYWVFIQNNFYSLDRKRTALFTNKPSIIRRSKTNFTGPRIPEFNWPKDRFFIRFYWEFSVRWVIPEARDKTITWVAWHLKIATKNSKFIYFSDRTSQKPKPDVTMYLLSSMYELSCYSYRMESIHTVTAAYI